MRIDGSQFKMGDAEGRVSFTGTKRPLQLRIFIDRSVLEIFANDTLCATKIISPLDSDGTLQISCSNGAAELKRIEAWPVKTIW
jgi:beta-fructofuranosidase